MKKFEYAQIMLKNEDEWADAGLIEVGWGAKNTNKVGAMDFANKLGKEGWEMYSVVQYGVDSVYFFKREI